MIRHKALYDLSHEHHHGLVLAQLIKQGSPIYENLPQTVEDKKSYTIKFYKENLIPHFKKEEEILFRVAKGKSLTVDNLIDELIEQHNRMNLLIKKLENSNSVEKVLDEFGRFLEAHIRREERELFQELQNILNEKELSKLEKQLGFASSSCKI